MQLAITCYNSTKSNKQLNQVIKKCEEGVLETLLRRNMYNEQKYNAHTSLITSIALV